MLATKTRLGALAGAVLLLGSGSAHAQGQVWVSRSGDNSNDCLTPTTPCRSIGAAGALSKVAAGGTIHVLPGSYGTALILKSVSIIADGGQADITGTTFENGPANAAFIVSAGANDVVRLRGLIVNPAVENPFEGGSSIALIAGGALHIENCTLIGSDENSAVNFAPTGASELYVSNSKIAENGTASTGAGILIRPTGSGSAKALIEGVLVENNAAGIVIDGRLTTGSNVVTVSNSRIAGNTTHGLFAADSGGGSTNVVVDGSTSADNTTFGVGAIGSNATVRVKNSTITGNANGLIAAGGSKIISQGGNTVAGNTTNGAFTQTLPLQ